jgi:hypothetical protein
MKGLIYLGILIGGAIGSYVPVLLGQGAFSLASIFGSGVGSILGLWAGYKLGNSL